MNNGYCYYGVVVQGSGAPDSSRFEQLYGGDAFLESGNSEEGGKRSSARV